MIHPSPHAVIGVVGALSLVVMALVVTVALQLPWMGVTFSANDEQLLIQSVDATGPNASAAKPGQVLQAFELADESIAARPVLLIEEPDMLPDFHLFNVLMTDQSRLTHTAESGQLTVLMVSGERLLQRVASRPLQALPWLFWLQLAFGISGALTGAIIWS